MRKVKVAITVLAMILLSGFAAGQLSAETVDEQLANLQTEIDAMVENEKAEREAFNARVEASKLKIAEDQAKNAYKNAWLHSMAAKKYFDLIHGEGNWASNIDYSKIAEEEAR